MIPIEQPHGWGTAYLHHPDFVRALVPKTPRRPNDPDEVRTALILDHGITLESCEDVEVIRRRIEDAYAVTTPDNLEAMAQSVAAPSTADRFHELYAEGLIQHPDSDRAERCHHTRHVAFCRECGVPLEGPR